jgi:hypothetical protein
MSDCGAWTSWTTRLKQEQPAAFQAGQDACEAADGDPAGVVCPYPSESDEAAAFGAGWAAYWNPRWCVGCEHGCSGGAP